MKKTLIYIMLWIQMYHNQAMKQKQGSKNLNPILSVILVNDFVRA